MSEGRRTRWAAIAGLGSLAIGLGACFGGDDFNADGAGDADADADENATFTGRVVGEVAVAPHPPLAGVEVELLDAEGALLDGAETDAAGRYTLAADPANSAFVVAYPTAGYAGQVRAEGIRDGFDFYDITLQADAGLQAVHEAVGLTYDPARGTVVLGFNPADHDAGGEGGAIDTVLHDPPFILLDDGAVSGARLPPICPNSGADACVDGARGDFVFFPNVAPGLHRVTLIQPSGGTCHQRFDIDGWLVLAQTSTIIEVDCVAD